VRRRTIYLAREPVNTDLAFPSLQRVNPGNRLAIRRTDSRDIRRIVAFMASLRRLLGFLAMSLVALVVAHSLVFLLAYGSGYDEALAHSGHDGTWRTSVAVVLAAAFALLGLGTWRLHRLGVVARALGASEGGLRGPNGFVRRLVELWVRLATATTVLFVLQENLEHQRVGGGLPGLSVLGSAEYPNAALVIAAIALAVALVVELFRCRRDVLVARIGAARKPWQGPAPSVPRHPAIWVERRHASLVVHQFSGRAPPQLGLA
jgi:hypothetical protein